MAADPTRPIEDVRAFLAEYKALCERHGFHLISDDTLDVQHVDPAVGIEIPTVYTVEWVEDGRTRHKFIDIPTGQEG